jgi:hypothetical protein
MKSLHGILALLDGAFAEGCREPTLLPILNELVALDLDAQQADIGNNNNKVELCPAVTSPRCQIE